MSAAVERRLLQLIIALAGIVPVAAGLLGGLLGGAMTGSGPLPSPDLDSHIRYLSGLLLGIGIAFWVSIPAIERHTGRVRLLTGIVAIGGLMRLTGFVLHGVPGTPMQLALVMELVVTPAICLWQTRVAGRTNPFLKGDGGRRAAG